MDTSYFSDDLAKPTKLMAYVYHGPTEEKTHVLRITYRHVHDSPMDLLSRKLIWCKMGPYQHNSYKLAYNATYRGCKPQKPVDVRPSGPILCGISTSGNQSQAVFSHGCLVKQPVFQSNDLDAPIETAKLFGKKTVSMELVLVLRVFTV